MAYPAQNITPESYYTFSQDLLFQGCTACVCFIDKYTNKAYVANLGDSRALYTKANTEYLDLKSLSRDHKPADAGEYARITGAGYEFSDYYVECPPHLNSLPFSYGLALTRALGDFDYKNNMLSDDGDSSQFCISNEAEVRVV